jgi:hypothetical protein
MFRHLRMHPIVPRPAKLLLKKRGITVTSLLKPTRRTALKLFGASAALLATPHIIRPSFAAGGVLNVTTYDKFLPQDFLDKFQKDTGIEVRVRLTDDQGKQYNLLTAEGANPSTDICTVAGHRYSQFINSNGKDRQLEEPQYRLPGCPVGSRRRQSVGPAGPFRLRGPRPQRRSDKGRSELGDHVRSAVQGADVLYRQRLPDDRHAVSRP